MWLTSLEKQRGANTQNNSKAAGPAMFWCNGSEQVKPNR
jgi:hypothetical protein